MIVSLALCGTIFAQNPHNLTSHWSDFSNQPYNDQEPFVAAIAIDGVLFSVENGNINNDDFEYLEVAAFVGEDECRGNLMFLNDEYVDEFDDPYPILDACPIYYTDAGDAVYFKMYDHLNNILYTECTITYLGEELTVYTGEEHLEYYNNDFEAPIILNFITPSESQETLTVYEDGTDKNQYVPFYGLYADTQGAASECIIPSDELEDMAGGQITAMKFYLGTPAAAAWSGTHQVYLGEVDETTLTGITGPSAFTVVSTASFDATGTELTVEFDEPYSYEGGNLLIGTYVSVAGNNKSAYFYGVNQTENTGWYRNNGSASGSAVKFLPKTTFTYVPAATTGCPKPQSLVVSDVTAHGATLTWEGDASEYGFNLEYKKVTEETWAHIGLGNTTFSFTLTELEENTAYDVRVQAVCDLEDDNNNSRWRTANFTTPVACPAPTGLAVTYEGGTTATLAWTENGTATEWDIEYGTDEEFNAYTTVNVSENPSTELTGLDLATTYYVRVKTYCGSEGYSTYSNTVDFTTDLCLADNMCAITIALTDSYGDGWNGGQLSVVDVLTENVLGTYTISSGSSANYTLNVCDGRDINIVYTAGNYSTENGWVVTDINGEVICEHEGCNNGCTPTTGIQATYTVNCAPPTCLKPTDLTVNYTGGATAIVTWEGEAETYNIDVNGEVTEGVTSPYTLEDLAPATDYAVMVQADCGSDGTSDWTNAVSFTGLTPAPTLPTDVEVTPTATTGEVAWVAGENNGSWNLRWRPYVDPALAPTVWDLPLDGYEEQLVGWLAYDADGDGNVWGLAYSNSAQDDLCFYSASWTSGTGSLTPDNWLITPEVALGGTLKFDTWNYMSSYPEKIMVYVCSNPAFESLDEFVAISAFIQPGTAHETIELSLSEFTGTGRIAFRHYDCEDKYQIFVDNIKVFPVNGVEIPEWTVVENVESPYTIEGLTPSTEYEVQVKAFNEEGDGMTDWTESVVFTTLDAPTFTKDIVGYGEGEGNYYLIASPIGTVNPENVGSMLDNEYDLYSFDQSQNLAEWQNYKTGAFNLVSGQGYLYANSEDVTLTFVGTPMDSDTYEVTLAYDDDANLKGWNLVGNPFGETAYIDRDFYTMNGDGSEIIASTSSSIEAMEGIFVIAEYDGETMTFSAIAPEDKGANLALNLSQGRGVIDRAIVRFGEGQQLPKLQLNPNHTKVYIPMDGEDYAVVRSEGMGELPLNFKAESNGTYGLSINSDAEFSYLHLIDNITGMDIDLLETPSYSFEANTTDYASRFKLVFATGNNEDNFAFFSNGNFIVSNEGEAVLQVVDVNGRILSSENISGCASVNVKAAAGVYMLRLVNGDNVKVQKVVVK